MAKSKKHYSLEKRKARMGYVYMAPLLFGLLVLFIPNMISTVRFTLFDIELGTGSLRLEYIGAANYIRAFTADIRFKTYLVETIGSLVTQIPVIVIFSLFIAVVLNQKFRGRVVVRTIFFLPVILATGILLSAESTLESAGTAIGTSDTGALAGGQDLLGNITAMLSSIGFGETLTDIVVGAANGIYSVVMSSGIQIFIFLATVQEMPSSLYNAARVEGCDGWQSFWKITFPAIVPAIVICLIYTAIDTFTKAGSSLDSYLQEQTSSQYGYGITMSLLYFCCIALLVGAVALVIRLLTVELRGRR